jgi:hypothetical protein
VCKAKRTMPLAAFLNGLQHETKSKMHTFIQTALLYSTLLDQMERATSNVFITRP